MWQLLSEAHKTKCNGRKILFLAVLKQLLATRSSFYAHCTALKSNDIIRVVLIRTALDADRKFDCTKIVISFSKKIASTIIWSESKTFQSVFYSTVRIIFKFLLLKNTFYK